MDGRMWSPLDEQWHWNHAVKFADRAVGVGRGLLCVSPPLFAVNCVARYHSSSSKLKLTEESLSLGPLHVAAAYALNPLTIATCVAMSTGVFHNFILSLMLFFTLRGVFLASCLLLYDVCQCSICVLDDGRTILVKQSAGCCPLGISPLMILIEILLNTHSSVL